MGLREIPRGERESKRTLCEPSVIVVCSLIRSRNFSWTDLVSKGMKATEVCRTNKKQKTTKNQNRPRVPGAGEKPNEPIETIDGYFAIFTKVVDPLARNAALIPCVWFRFRLHEIVPLLLLFRTTTTTTTTTIEFHSRHVWYTAHNPSHCDGNIRSRLGLRRRCPVGRRLLVELRQHGKIL